MDGKDVAQIFVEMWMGLTVWIDDGVVNDQSREPELAQRRLAAGRRQLAATPVRWLKLVSRS